MTERNVLKILFLNLKKVLKIDLSPKKLLTIEEHIVEMVRVSSNLT